MLKRLLIVLLLLCINSAFIEASRLNKKVEYNLTNENIDVVIVSHSKDKGTLDLCISGISQNCASIRRIVVVSAERLTDKAEWFDEANYPFTKKEVGLKIEKNKFAAQMFFELHRNLGWYYQQLLKLYAPFVIPGLSSNVLIIDADTIFLNSVEFLNEKNGALFCLSDFKKMGNYFEHAERLVPNFEKAYPEVYCVCHHMLFQKAVLEDLFETVEKHHKKPFWEAFCSCVDTKKGGASEYIIYFCFACSRSDQFELRPLKWQNSSDLKKIDLFRNENFHFVSFHTYLRHYVNS